MRLPTWLRTTLRETIAFLHLTKPVLYCVHLVHRAAHKVNLFIIRAGFLFGIYSHKTRLCGIWDFNMQSGTMGDALIFQEILLCLQDEFKLSKKMELCYIDNSHNPRYGYAKTQTWKDMIMSTSVVNNKINKVHKFNHPLAFQKWRKGKELIYWPSPFGFSRAYPMNEIERFFKRHGHIPKMEFPVSIERRIDAILGPIEKKPIGITVRKLARGTHQNMDLREIEKFLKHYEKSDEFVFVIICSKEEVPEELRRHKNVLIARDYTKSIEEDYCMVSKMHICLFPVSGISMVGYFTKTPFLQYDYAEDKKVDILNLKTNTKYNFLNNYQRIFWKPLKASWLIKEFEKLVKDLEKRDSNG